MTTILKTTPQEVEKWLKNNDAVIVDVRENIEYKIHHIQGATNLPLSLVRLDHDHMPDHKGKRLIFQCKSGKRSQMACEKIAKEGVELKIWNLEGGIDTWISQGFAVEENQRKIIPLERQVMIAAGSIVSTGIFFGFSLHENWFWLSGFAGAGLLLGGLTGWCGMAMLLAKAPWNTKS